MPDMSGAGMSPGDKITITILASDRRASSLGDVDGDHLRPTLSSEHLPGPLSSYSDPIFWIVNLWSTRDTDLDLICRVHCS